MAAIMIIRVVGGEKENCHMFVIIQCPWLSDHPMLSSRRASPIRLVSAVIIPALSDLGFW